MNQELSTTSILALIDTTKEARLSFVRSTIEELKEGNRDPLLVHIHCKNMEQMIKELTGDKDFKDMVLAEANKYGKAFERHNAKVQIKEVGSTYDYSVCEDVVYGDLVNKMAELKKTMSAREKFLQNIPDGGIADPDNGNMIYRAAKASTTAISVTLK